MKRNTYCSPILSREQCELTIALLKGVVKFNEERGKNYPHGRRSIFCIQDTLDENVAILKIVNELLKAINREQVVFITKRSSNRIMKELKKEAKND